MPGLFFNYKMNVLSGMKYM